jgi:hypothetical protein
MHLDDYSCVFCYNIGDEVVEHLFLYCPFAQQCWNSINTNISSSWSPFETRASQTADFSPLIHENNYFDDMEFLDLPKQGNLQMSTFLGSDQQS